MLSFEAIEEYWSRDLRDSANAKAVHEDDLDAMLENGGYEFIKPLRYAQKVCFLLGMKYPKYQFNAGCGAGKTYLSISLFRNRDAERMLVLVPNVINLPEWVSQVAEYLPGKTCTAITQSGREARLKAMEEGDVVVITYQGLANVCSELAMVKKGRKMKKGWKYSSKTAKKVSSMFDMLIIDESTSIKNPTSLYFKAVRYIANHVPYVYGLTGTPFEKSPIDLWSQMLVIDGGYSLGESLGLFRSVFFNETENEYGYREYNFDGRKRSTLARRLRHASVRFTEAECQDLPPAVGGLSGGQPLLIQSSMPKEHQRYYDAAEQEFQSIQNGSITAVASAYARMRMVSSGWLGALTDDGEKVELTFKKNPKLDALMAKIEELGGEKVIIVHFYNHSGKLITDRLKKSKKSHVWIYGKTPGARKAEYLSAFKDPSGPQVLVASPAIAMGVNLQSASRYMFFFESPDSSIVRHQLESRILREGGLEGARFYYDCVTRGSRDLEILESVIAGEDLMNKITSE